MPVHPHGRGEHNTSGFEVSNNAGSSPRSWGTPICQLLAGPRIRFIPTVVGNTPPAYLLLLAGAVHPHGRGEHPACSDALLRYSGSSPRSWGTPRLHAPAITLLRFIPTVVGNTCSLESPLFTRPVHPHGRGEHEQVLCSYCRGYGSSPRSWGTLALLQRVKMAFRFIPTVVGNTFIMLSAIAPVPVHPHGRGEHFEDQVSRQLNDGSSPRSWGTR